MSRIEYEESMKFYTFLVSSARKVYQHLKCQEVRTSIKKCHGSISIFKMSKFQICFELEVYQYLKKKYINILQSYKYVNILPHVKEVYYY